MPPVSSENSYSPENPINRNEQFMEIERGDVQPAPMQDDNTTTQNTNQNNQQSQQQQPVKQNQQLDPVVFVKSMISAGFTPTRAQIVSATNHISGTQDSSNTWFAMFLQRLLRQYKLKKSKKP